MSSRNRYLVRRPAVLLAVALAFTGATGAPAAVALPGFAFERLAGADRYGTAAAIARDTFTSTDDVVLASGAAGDFADALAGNYVAGQLSAPVLLTAPDKLPSVTLATLAALGAERVVIVGGTASVSSAVERELRAAGYRVERLGGADRYETAELVSKRPGPAGTSIGTVGGARTAVLGNGEDYPDILAAGPLSYSHRFPLAITRPRSLPASTRDLLRDLGIQHVLIVGGVAAVSSEVEAEVARLGIAVTRLQGADRVGTSVAIAEYAYSRLGYDRRRADLARSDGFADALAGGPRAGTLHAPIVLTAAGTLSAATGAFLSAAAGTLTTGHIFGGTSAVSSAVASVAELRAGDATDPRISAPSAAPATGATSITFTADEALLPSSVTAEDVTVTGGTAQATVTQVVVSDRLVQVTTSPLQEGNVVTLQARSVTDLAGRVGPATAVSTTAVSSAAAPPPPAPPPPAPADTTAPTVAPQGQAPAAGATEVTFTASETLRASSVSSSDFAVSGGTSRATLVGVEVSDRLIRVTTTALAEGNVVTLASGSVADLAGNTGPAAPVATAPAVADTLKALWHMEDATHTMVDATGNGHDGTSTDNVALREQGSSGFGYGFTGRPSYVTVPSASAFNPDAGDFAVTAHIRFSSLPPGGDVNTYEIVRKGVSETVGGDWKLEILGSGKPHCLFAGSAGQASVVGPVDLSDGAWHTVTCSRTASTITLVVDGAGTSTVRETGTIANSEPVILGVKNTAGDDQYVGFLDEVSVRKG